MTETPDTATTTVENTTEEPAEAVDQADTEHDDHLLDDNREAAKYRHRAKAAEAERDQLAERLQVAHRKEIERLASEHLQDGADVWRESAELKSMLTEDGDVDPEKVTATAKQLLESHRHWRKTAPAAPPASTVTANGKIGRDTRPSFVDAFAPRSG